jgi:hypothetical protein
MFPEAPENENDGVPLKQPERSSVAATTRLCAASRVTGYVETVKPGAVPPCTATVSEVEWVMLPEVAVIGRV